MCHAEEGLEVGKADSVAWGNQRRHLISFPFCCLSSTAAAAFALNFVRGSDSLLEPLTEIELISRRRNTSFLRKGRVNVLFELKFGTDFYYFCLSDT